MQTATRKHLSVVGGIARFAQVTVVKLTPDDPATPIQKPNLILNDRLIDRRLQDDDRFVEAAVHAVRETEAKLGWRGPPLQVAKIESSYVDMHPDAARIAAISAATALIEGV
jgi:hypothetical protein